MITKNMKKNMNYLSGGTRLRKGVLMSLISLFSFAGIAQTTHYVDADASGGDDGTSWADAYTDLHNALMAAGSGDSIFVAEGTYKPSGDGLNNVRDATFDIPEGVLVYGGFEGNEANLADRPNPLLRTILSGDISGPNAYHVVEMKNAGAVLDGFTVRDGLADKSGSSNGNGAGLFVDAEVTIQNLEVRNNEATNFGGGIYVKKAMVKNCTFHNNKSTLLFNSGGGGIHMSDSETKVIDCEIYNNEAVNGNGIYLNRGEVVNCLIRNNRQGTGAVFVRNGKLINSTIYGNTTTFSNAGLFISQSANDEAFVANCIIANNARSGSSGTNGVDFYNDKATDLGIRMENCIISSDIDGRNDHKIRITEVQEAVEAGFESEDVDASDFLRLSEQSLAVNAGNNSHIDTDAYPTDLDGNDRLVSGTVDLGCYESSHSVEPTLGLSEGGDYVLYPNPVGGDGFLHINAVQVGDRVEVVDLEGHLLVNRTLRRGNERLSVANMPAGAYLVIITPANGKGTAPKVLRLVRE